MLRNEKIWDLLSKLNGEEINMDVSGCFCFFGRLEVFKIIFYECF